jgi:uncharacterized protein YgfB (UPF0149 family)
VIGIGIGMTVHKLSVANNGTKSVIHNYIDVSDSESEKEDNTDEDKRDNNENEITKSPVVESTLLITLLTVRSTLMASVSIIYW